MVSVDFSSGSAVYIRYKDHVLFKNTKHPLEEAIERETIGWLSKENNEIILVEHDRTTPDIKLSSGQTSGLIIIKSCITEIRKLPLQEISEWRLNSQKTTDEAEYALQPTKRKTRQNSNRTGAAK